MLTKLQGVVGSRNLLPSSSSNLHYNLSSIPSSSFCNNHHNNHSYHTFSNNKPHSALHSSHNFTNNLISNSRYNSLYSSSSSSFVQFSRFIHNPLRVRGVGPRPSTKPTLLQKLRVIERRKQWIGDRTAISGPVIYKEPVYKHNVYNLATGEITREIELPSDLFGQQIRGDIIQQVVVWQRAKARQGTHKTKTRGEVSGTGKKPHPQKGSGMARQGTKRAPHHRGGGTAHGKKPRNYDYPLPKKVKRLGLKIALSAKFQEKNLIIIENTTVESAKTKFLKQLLTRMNINEFLMIHAHRELDKNIIVGARNLKYHDFLPAKGANVLSIIRHPTLILTMKGLKELESRCRASALKNGPMFMVGKDGGGMNYLDYQEWKKTQLQIAAGNNTSNNDSTETQQKQTV